MTPKEKAKELVDKYSKRAEDLCEYTEYEYDKECALICVDEIIYTTKIKKYKANFIGNTLDAKDYTFKYSEYWKKVKKEIEKL